MESRAGTGHGDAVTAVAGFALLLFPILLVLPAGWVVGPGDGPDRLEFLLLVQGFNCLCVFALAGLRRRSLGLGVGRLRVAIGAYLVFLPLWFLVAWQAYQLIAEALGAPILVQPHLQYFFAFQWDRATAWGAVAVVVLFGPLAEEIVFRGWIQPTVASHFGRHAGLLATSVLFGLVHDLDKAVPLAVLGAFFGYLRDRTGGLLAPFVCHALHNLITVGSAILFPEVVRSLYSAGT